MPFRVELSVQAEREADAILAWLEEQGAGRTGIDWVLALEDAVLSLERMPARCPLAMESKSFPYEVRELRYGRKPHVYRILFSIRGEVVEIHHIRHARRRRIA